MTTGLATSILICNVNHVCLKSKHNFTAHRIITNQFTRSLPTIPSHCTSVTIGRSDFFIMGHGTIVRVMKSIFRGLHGQKEIESKFSLCTYARTFPSFGSIIELNLMTQGENEPPRLNRTLALSNYRKLNVSLF